MPAAAEPTRRASVATLGSRRLWMVAAAVGLLVLAAGAAFLLLGNESESEPREATALDDTAFWEAANSALGGLIAANLQAQTNLALSLPTGTEDQLYGDGTTILSSTDGAADQLRALANLSPAQVDQRETTAGLPRSERPLRNHDPAIRPPVRRLRRGPGGRGRSGRCPHSGNQRAPAGGTASSSRACSVSRHPRSPRKRQHRRLSRRRLPPSLSHRRPTTSTTSTVS